MENSVIYKDCDMLLDELTKFDGSILNLGTFINDDRIRILEKNIGFNLPLDFKYIISVHNGVSLIGTTVYGLDETFKEESLDKIYHFEHFKVVNPMPAHLFPFSPDGGGNHYCLDLSQISNDISPVVFWQWDFSYEHLNQIERCNESFTDWMQEVMIDWTLEDTNYDGG